MKLKEKLLNKKNLVLIIGVVCVFCTGLAVGAQAGSEAGSVNDPLVTKSYLDARLENVGAGSGSNQSSYTKVVLKKGDVLIGYEGTEILLYSGSGTAYSAGKGIVNTTVGELSSNGTTLGKYCVYVTPDADSGIKAESDMVLFVKGRYSTNN